MQNMTSIDKYIFFYIYRQTTNHVWRKYKMPSDAFEYLYLDVSIASKLRLPTRVQSAFAKLFINVYNQQANKMPTPSQTGRTILIRQYSFHQR